MIVPRSQSASRRYKNFNVPSPCPSLYYSYQINLSWLDMFNMNQTISLAFHQVVDFLTAWLFYEIFFPTNDDFLIFFLRLPSPDWLTEVNNRWRAHKVLALFTNILCFWGERIAQRGREGGRAAPNCSFTTESYLETIMMIIILTGAWSSREGNAPTTDNSWNSSWHQRKFHWVCSLFSSSLLHRLAADCEFEEITNSELRPAEIGSQ